MPSSPLFFVFYGPSTVICIPFKNKDGAHSTLLGEEKEEEKKLFFLSLFMVEVPLSPFSTRRRRKGEGLITIKKKKKKKKKKKPGVCHTTDGYLSIFFMIIFLTGLGTVWHYNTQKV